MWGFLSWIILTLYFPYASIAAVIELEAHYANLKEGYVLYLRIDVKAMLLWSNSIRSTYFLSMAQISFKVLHIRDMIY